MGDARAYRRWLTSIAVYVRGIARARCRLFGAAECEAEDIVQDVLLAMHLNRGTWDSSRPIGPWAAAITRNKLIDALRRRGRYEWIPIEELENQLIAESGLNIPAAWEVGALLKQLKDRQRDIVRSISLSGNTISQTAARLQMSEGAVRVALHRALKALGNLHRRSATENLPA